jgi:serine/threonine-protein kinase RsbW
VLDQRFDAGTLHLLRTAVLAHAVAAGMPESRAGDVVIATHELAANAVRHGAGRLRMQAEAGALRSQVEDDGKSGFSGPAGAGAVDGHEIDRADGWPYLPGHGLWLVRQVASQ